MYQNLSTSPRAEEIKNEIKGWLEEARSKLPKEPVEVEIWRILDHMREEIERSNRVITNLLNKGNADVSLVASQPHQHSF